MSMLRRVRRSTRAPADSHPDEQPRWQRDKTEPAEQATRAAGGAATGLDRLGNAFARVRIALLPLHAVDRPIHALLDAVAINVNAFLDRARIAVITKAWNTLTCPKLCVRNAFTGAGVATLTFRAINTRVPTGACDAFI